MSEERPSSPWLNAKEAAQYLGRNNRASYRWIIRMAKHGSIKGSGVGFDGKNWKFKTEALDNWVIARAKKEAA